MREATYRLPHGSFLFSIPPIIIKQGMAGYEIHVCPCECMLRFSRNVSVRKQPLFDAINEQVGWAKGFFRQEPECIRLRFLILPVKSLSSDCSSK